MEITRIRRARHRRRLHAVKASRADRRHATTKEAWLARVKPTTTCESLAQIERWKDKEIAHSAPIERGKSGSCVAIPSSLFARRPVFSDHKVMSEGHVHTFDAADYCDRLPNTFYRIDGLNRLGRHLDER
jgi:hypothetical protein